MMKEKRVVITGIGIVSPVGIGKEEFWQAIEQGRSGIRPIKSFSTKPLKAKFAAEVNKFDIKKILNRDKVKDFNRAASFLCVSVKLALDDAKFDITDKNKDAIGICTATTISNTKSFSRFHREISKFGPLLVSPMIFPQTLLNSISSLAAIYFKIQGSNTTISTGFTAGLDAVRYGVNLISLGRAKMVLVTGVEEISSPSFMAFYKIGALAGIQGKEVSYPFDRGRNGFILGEGAVALVLENEADAKKRKASICASVLGAGSFFDVHRTKRFNQSPRGMKKSMAGAIKESAVNIKDIDYISASANSTQTLDRLEVEAIKEVFGRYSKKIPVSSIKSMIGETFSGAGIFQIAATIGMMKKTFIAPTVNYKDKNCDLYYVPNKTIKKKIKTALINNFSATGNNTSIMLGKYV